MRWGDAGTFPEIERLEQRIVQARSRVEDHRVYGLLTSVDAVRVFMEHHVFAVWDFMSLLKALQAQFTCVSVPWRPVGSPSTRRFVNELVLEEESDALGEGYTSHFELYLAGMRACGADTGPIEAFLDLLAGGETVAAGLAASGAPGPACDFVRSTWRTLEGATPHGIAAAFALGRESLIPAMFTNVRAVGAAAPRLATFFDYLDRHIELDGEIHTPLAFRLLTEACDGDPVRWAEVEDVARTTLTARADLWDAVAAELDLLQPPAVPAEDFRPPVQGGMARTGAAAGS